MLRKNEPILVQENYRENGELKSIYQYIDKDPRKTCLIPRWAVFLSSSIGCCILLALIAALAVVYFWWRPSLHQESCLNGRNCIKGLDLKCINGTCLCDTGYFYSNKCTLKKNYMEQCHQTSQCKDNMNMICKDGVCECESYYYWNGSCCTNENLINKQCKNDVECITDTVLYCDTNLGICACDNYTRYWDGVSCFPKRTYNERCNNDTSQCISWQNLICQNGLCVCNSTQYWDWFTNACLNKHFENKTCITTVECFSPMTCTSLGICKCGAFEYHDYSTLTCKPQKSFNVSCSVEYNCRVDKYLNCSNGFCSCITQFPVWSYGYDKCIIPKNYTEKCFSTNDCNANKNLICNDATYNCTCPTNTAIGQCDCVREVGNENYWDGSSCTPAIAYSQSCTSSYMCKTMTEGTYCDGTGKCKCKTNYYYSFTTFSCQSQLTVNKACTQGDACLSIYGLSCQLGVCLCDEASQFWNTLLNPKKCVPYFTYGGGVCTSSSQCSSNLICRSNSIGSTCGCPTSLGLGVCDCTPRVDNSEFYWNYSTSKCTLAGYYGDSCSVSYQCQTIKGLACRSGICQCPSANSMWKSHTAQCVSCPSGWPYYNGDCYGYAVSCPAGSSVASNLCSIGAGFNGIASQIGGIAGNFGYLGNGCSAGGGNCYGYAEGHPAGSGWGTHECHKMGGGASHGYICKMAL